MATNDENRSRVDRNRSRDKNRSPIQSEIDTTLNTFSFNVTQAKDDAKKIYQNLGNQHKTYLGAVEKSTKATYTRMYKDLSHQHSQYLTNLVNREKAAHDKIAQIWGGAANIPNNGGTTPPSPPSGKDKDKKDKNDEEVVERLDIITTVVKEFFKTFLNGADQFVKTYTQNYNKYTTAFNTNYKGLTTIISSSIDQLDSSIGSRAYNITRDLLPALEKVASTGLQGSKAITKATDDVIASKIMPYLETQSATWTNLYANLSESNIQTLKGQQLLLKQTEAGSRLLQSGVINSLTDELEPLLRDIEYNTSAKDMGEYQSVLEGLVAEGVSEREAYDIVKTAISASKNPFAALTSGSPTAILAGMDVARGGSGIEGLQRSYGLSAQATNRISTGAMAYAMGWSMSATTPEVSASIRAGLEKTSSQTAKDAKAFYNKQVSQIEDVVHNTDKLNNSVENLGAKMLGMWTKDIAQPITNLLWMIFGAIVSGQGVSLLGKGIGASGKGGILAKALQTGVGSKIVGGSTAAAGGALSSVAAGAGVLAGIYTAYDGIKDFAGSQSGVAGEGAKTRGVIKAGSALGGAAIGAAIGAVGGPIGVGVGALAGAVIGQVVAAFYDAPYEKTLERVNKLSQSISDLNKAADTQNTIKSLTDSYESLTDEQKIQLQVLKDTHAIQQQIAVEQVQEFAGSDTLGEDWNRAKSAYYSAREAYGKAYKSGDATKISEAEQQLSSAVATWQAFSAIYKNAQYLTANQIENVYSQLGDLSMNSDEDLALLGVSRSDLSAWSDWMDSRAEGYKGRHGGKGSSYAVGSDYITHDQVATIHEGEMVLTKADSALLRTIGQNASSTMSTYYSNQNKSSTEIVDAIKWAVSQLLPAISSSVSTTSNGNGSLDVKLPGSIGYNDNMISMVRWAMA